MGERYENQEGDTYLEQSQSLTHDRFEGELYPRLPYGLEAFRNPVESDHKPCPHCGAVKGQLHEPLCDYEECPACGLQVMSCDCGIFTEDAVPA